MDFGVRDGATFADPGRVAAIEHAHGLDAVGAQAPPRSRGEQALAVVIDHDGRGIADPEAGHERGHPVGPGQQQDLALLALVDEIGPPVDRDRTGDMSGRVDGRGAAIRTPAGVQDTDTGPIQLFGEPFRGGHVLGSGQAAHRRYHTAMVAPFSPEPERLAAVREALPALGAGIYLNTGSAGPLPSETAAAMAEFAAWELAVGRGSPDSFVEVVQRLAETRAAVAALLVTDPGSIAITHSTTDAINAIILALDLRAGDHIVTTRHEHPGVLGPVAVARARGVDVTIVDLGDGGDDELTLRAIDAAMTDKTRLVVISHVLWTTGAVLPIAAISAQAHARGALVVVDGAQSAGAILVDFEATGADAYAIASQKWLLGPEGMGALAVRPELTQQLTPALAGYGSFERIDDAGGAVLQPDARRFEWTFFHRPSAIGMARSISWLSMYVGLDWVYARGASMARKAADRLAGIPGVHILTPVHQMATLITFRIDGWTQTEVHAELGARVFAITRTIESLQALRISVAFFTTDDELERFAEAVALLAAHTPETLPPRRTLSILG